MMFRYWGDIPQYAKEEMGLSEGIKSFVIDNLFIEVNYYEELNPTSVRWDLYEQYAVIDNINQQIATSNPRVIGTNDYRVLNFKFK